MIKKYDKNEFVINGVEIREVEYSPEWENNDTCFSGYHIDSLEGYINGEQIDVEDVNVMSDELWDIITDKLNEQIEEEESLDF